MKKIVIFIGLLFISCELVYAKEDVSFYECVDGDTIKVIYNEEVVSVRLLAVDTPEIFSKKEDYELGIEASNFVCDKLKEALKIELEFDDNSDRYDKYDRLLAWVFVDDILLQEVIIKNGYGKVYYLYGDYKYTDMLLEYEEEAKNKKIGIWNDEGKRDELIVGSGVLFLIIVILFFGIWRYRYRT